ncbi:hypothetical protein Hanom_Chr01g00074801 [Helianthus anomalus]
MKLHKFVETYEYDNLYSCITQILNKPIQRQSSVHGWQHLPVYNKYLYATTLYLPG